MERNIFAHDVEENLRPNRVLRRMKQWYIAALRYLLSLADDEEVEQGVEMVEVPLGEISLPQRFPPLPDKQLQ